MRFAAIVVCTVVATISVPCGVIIGDCDKAVGTASVRASL
jgi:hypothetical protein